ncbi:MAG: hypothetical protein ACRDD1_06800, partial [Planctomycetia bacterium]
MTSPSNPPGFVCSINVGAGNMMPSAAAAPPAPTAAGPADELVQQLRELASLNREMIHLQREHLELARRAEERFVRQHQMQQDEFQRWVSEQPQLAGRCKQAQETIRTLLGNAL